MIENQEGTRNLTDGWKYQTSSIKRELLLEKGKQTQGKRADLLSIIDKKLSEIDKPYAIWKIRQPSRNRYDQAPALHGQ